MRAVNLISEYDEKEFFLGYEKYLREAFNEVTELELNQMEEDFFKSSALANRIISLKPANNQDYKGI